MQCDGYSGCNKEEDVIFAVCSAHCRRKFYEALPAERQKFIIDRFVRKFCLLRNYTATTMLANTEFAALLKQADTDRFTKNPNAENGGKGQESSCQYGRFRRFFRIQKRNCADMTMISIHRSVSSGRLSLCKCRMLRVLGAFSCAKWQN